MNIFDKIYMWWLKKSRAYLRKKSYKLHKKRIELDKENWTLRSEQRIIELDREWREED